MSYLGVSTSRVVFHAWGTKHDNSLASDSLHLLSDAVDARPIEFCLAQDKAHRALHGLNGNYILEEGSDLFKNIEPPFTASQVLSTS
ncbi:hypothetical protein ARMGADRAFT_1083893 [Armillaria gallica]|uniref:Uncharacterized protein n=1 Tax=Armillaria gallica TaxID=47427 RepID=A0A2H3DJW9_ARMGA|nr:hypothetical protein ARMGADRAFT_1083893 [Armillaria gallica]